MVAHAAHSAPAHRQNLPTTALTTGSRGGLECYLVITVIGEALVDLVASPDWSCRASPGGAPANVAVALARLERDVSLRARISRDGFGTMLRSHLSATASACATW